MKQLGIFYVYFIIYVLLVSINNCDAKKKKDKSIKAPPIISTLDQLFIKGKEESPQNFMRLLIMRLLYGLAAQFGFEERLSGLFNGAFVPPNADDDYSFFGDYDSGGGWFDALDL